MSEGVSFGAGIVVVLGNRMEQTRMFEDVLAYVGEVFINVGGTHHAYPPPKQPPTCSVTAPLPNQ